jgi:hypothetical protein
VKRNNKNEPQAQTWGGDGNEATTNLMLQLDFTTDGGECQIFALLALCLEKYNFHRARYISIGDAEDFRLALAARQDRADLLTQLEVGCD